MSNSDNMTKHEVLVETEKHIKNVEILMRKLAYMLIDRGEVHDLSKTRSPELPIFMEYTSKLATSTYGSDEYKQFLIEMKPALDHHYAHNRHHPEHFDDGINEMNLIDLIEMFCDWKAATMRHNDGDITKSIEINRKRFGISDQLANILHNTVDILQGYTS